MRRSFPLLLLLAAAAPACVDGDKLGDEDYVPLDDDSPGADGTDGGLGGDAGDGDGVGTSVEELQLTAEGGCLVPRLIFSTSWRTCCQSFVSRSFSKPW